jgi:DNA-binding GntR family transcriptional regulator
MDGARAETASANDLLAAHLDPAPAGPLKESLYAALREAVVGLDLYDPATPLRMDERGLAERLGISRTPLRAAIARLEQEGFVETRPRRGVFLRRKPLWEVLEMLEMWGALESMAARLACARADEAAVARLRRLARGYTPEGALAGLGEYSEANIAFHRAVLRLPGNRRMIDAGEGVLAHLAPIRRRATRDPSRAERSVEDHSAIVAAIEAREADLAARRVAAYNARLAAYLRRSWRYLTGEGARPSPNDREDAR